MYSPPKSMVPFLVLPAAMFEIAIRTRNLLYDRRFLASRRLEGPVISIGNLTLGGAGKTPLVIHVAQLVADLGKTPVLLSRGYRRRGPGSALILPPGTPNSRPALELGDEPALIRSKVPKIWLGISPDRFGTGRAIAGRLPGAVFILDDGMQHRKLARTLDIAVIDVTQRFAGNRIFPCGSLREPVGALRRCDAAVINGDVTDTRTAEVRQAIARMGARAEVFHCIQQITALARHSGGDVASAPAVRDRVRVFLVAAIGNPERFHRDVERLQLDIRGARFFRDHHVLSRDNWRSCWSRARALGAEFLLTTEKDAIKLAEAAGIPLLVARQSVRIVEEEAFRSLVCRSIQGSCIDEHQPQ